MCQIRSGKVRKTKLQGDCSFMCIIPGCLVECLYLFLSPAPSHTAKVSASWLVGGVLAGPLTY